MCGIVGMVDGPPLTADHPAHAMVQAVVHRGPDDQRVAGAGRAVFGTARLAMVDRPTSAQPISDPAGRRLLSFNGEVYNFRELRAELAAMGIEFRTEGDTEVVFQALGRWGAEALSRFKGQFAIAFWDDDIGELLLARDRFGIVPLYWTRSGGALAFASEVKALAAAGIATSLSVPDVVDNGVFWGVHPGRSVFAGVHSVEPGGFVRWRGGEATRGRYWRFEFAPTRDARELPDLADELRTLLHRAISRRIPEYGDPAVLLSGGLDSTTVLAFLRELLPDHRVDSYSIQFARTALDESRYQDLAADQFGTKHTSIVCDDVTVAESLVKAVDHAEAPLVRTAPAASLSLAATIEGHGTRAVLSGEGADELFCGYDLFKLAAIRAGWRDAGDPAELTARLESVMAQQRELGRAVERAFYEEGVDEPDDTLFSHLNRWSASFRLTQYLAPEARAVLPKAKVFAGARHRLAQAPRHPSVVERAQGLEVDYFLTSALLASQCDRPYMAHSIEARYPFLDEDVVDFALRLPEKAKLDGTNEKAILKAAVGGSIPDAIRNRVKQPYTAPEGDVFRSEAGRALLDQFVSPSEVARHGVFDGKRVAWLLDKLARARTSFHDDLAVLWIFSTQVLADRYGVSPIEP